jgi:hypothetical protein
MKVTKKQLAAILIGCSITMVAVLAFNYDRVVSKVEKEATSIEVKKEVKVVEEVKELPMVKPEKKKGILKQEIRTMAKYIKMRNSKIPQEIADLQAEFIVTIADKNKVNVSLVNGIIEKESLYDPTAVSKASARGLLQILRCDGVDIDPNKAHDLEYNIQTGISILQIKLSKTGNDLSSALQAYSGGSKDYARDVYANIGRYSMFREREEILNNSVAKVD